MAKGMKGAKLEAPEEHGKGHPSAKRGAFGHKAPNLTGPTPYSVHQSHNGGKGHSLEAHVATSGRGGPGKFGKGDGVKTRTEDLVEPQSHAEFETLGTDT